MSLSLHSSMEYLGGSNRWSRNDRDIEPEKSSIGLISSKISSRPETLLTSSRPAACEAVRRPFQMSFPSSQSKLSTCRARRFGTSSGSRILANEMRDEREAAKRCPSERSTRRRWCSAVGVRAVLGRAGGSIRRASCRECGGRRTQHCPGWGHRDDPDGGG